MAKTALPSLVALADDEHTGRVLYVLCSGGVW
jgi:hypothetical protein